MKRVEYFYGPVASKAGMLSIFKTRVAKQFSKRSLDNVMSNCYLWLVFHDYYYY